MDGFNEYSCKSRAYLCMYFCFYCDKTFPQMKDAARHHEVCQRRHTGEKLCLKSPDGYICKMHDPPLDCETGPNLRRHLFIYHRFQQDSTLNRNAFCQAKISSLPTSLPYRTNDFTRENERMD
jgi:hypothetical protein